MSPVARGEAGAGRHGCWEGAASWVAVHDARYVRQGTWVSDREERCFVLVARAERERGL